MESPGRPDTERGEVSIPESPLPELARNDSRIPPMTTLELPGDPNAGIGTKPTTSTCSLNADDSIVRTTMREILLDRTSKQEMQEQKELKLHESLVEAQNAIKLVQEGHNDMPLTTEFARSLMNDFMLRNRVVRQAIVYQVLTLLGLGIKVFQSDSYKQRYSDQINTSVLGPTLRVGIIGGGVMGKTIFEAIHKKVMRGRSGIKQASSSMLKSQPEFLRNSRWICFRMFESTLTTLVASRSVLLS